MGYVLKKIQVDGGMVMREKACENYTCASCGRKMISVNFVNGICIQVFSTHARGCAFVDGDGYQRTCEVTCDTCSYHLSGDGCRYEGAVDQRINTVRMHSA